MSFIDSHRAELGVEPICRELAPLIPLAPHPPTTNMRPGLLTLPNGRRVPGGMTRSSSRSSVFTTTAPASMARARSGTRCAEREPQLPNARSSG